MIGRIPAPLHSTTASAASGAGNTSDDSAGKLDWQQQKELQAQKRKLENQLKKCEDRIATLEQRISEIEEEMAKPEVATNVARLQELSKEQTALSEELEQKYEEWEQLQS